MNPDSPIVWVFSCSREGHVVMQGLGCWLETLSPMAELTDEECPQVVFWKEPVPQSKTTSNECQDGVYPLGCRTKSAEPAPVLKTGNETDRFTLSSFRQEAGAR